MIRRVQALDYKCLRHVDQTLGNFHVLVGANASGKTTFLDTISFVGDLLSEGLDFALGERQEGNVAEQLTWRGAGSKFEVALDLEIPAQLRDRENGSSRTGCRYEVSIGVRAPSDGEPEIKGETFWLKGSESRIQDKPPDLFPEEPTVPPTIANRKPGAGWRRIVNKVSESGNDYFRGETTNWNNLFRIGSHKSALANLPEDEEKFPVATWAKLFLAGGIVKLRLSGRAMQMPSPYYRAKVLYGDGQNLPWLVRQLKERSESEFGAWIEHVRTAIPDLLTVETIERPEDRSLYLQIAYENGTKVPSWLVSEGTLRLLALTILAYDPAGGNVYLIEEPENGLHPRAVETVFQSLSSVQDS